MVKDHEKAFMRSLKAWGLLAIVMIPAAIAGSIGFLLISMLGPPIDGLRHPFSTDDVASAAMVVMLGLPLAIPFAALGAPFAFARHWLVRGTFPYLRVGYLTVVLYGPALLFLAYRSNPSVPGYWMWSGLYEVVALAATLLFPMAKRLCLIDP